MRFFRRKPAWIDFPFDAYSYPPDFKKVILKIREAFHSIFQKELDDLARLGLPLPVLQSRFAIEPHPSPDDPYELESVVLHFPRYRRPPTFITKVHWDSVETYFLISYSDPEMSKRVLREFLDEGLLKLKQSYKCLWLNRDPYSFFECDVREQSIRLEDVSYGKTVTPAALHLSKRFPYLRTKVPMPDERIKARQERLLWFATLGHGADPGFDPERAASYAADLTSTNLLQFAETFPLPPLPQRAASIFIKVIPPQDTKPAIFQAFLEVLGDVKRSVTFEIVAEAGRIYFQFVCSANDQKFIEQQLQVHFPECSTVIQKAAAPVTLHTLYAVPSSPFRQFKHLREFVLDPYSQLFAQISNLPPNERAYVRMNFAPVSKKALGLASDPLAAQILKEEEDLKENSKNLKIIKWLGQEDLKIEGPKRRITGLSRRIGDLLVKSWFFGMVLQSSNRSLLESIKTRFLQPLETPSQKWKFSEVIQRTSPDLPVWSKGVCPWNLVSTEELATLVHFPIKDIQCERLEVASMKTKLPPDLYTQTGIRLGTSTAYGQQKPVTVPLSVRDRHLYVVGKSGTGKSTLLYNCIRQDIEQGFGVAVIDPHGDLADDVLHSIPGHRINDTIYLNAKDTQHPIGLNIMNAKSEDEIGILADDLLVTFKRLSESWGERMENILRYSFHSLLRYPGATLLDLKSLLQRQDFRERVIASLQHPALSDFWQYEYPNYPKDASAPILNRVSKFTLSPVLSGILGQAESRLNFFEVIQSKKILLVKIAKGEIGEDTAHLLGSLLVSQLQLAIMRRAALPKEARVPYFLYVDEFQNFTTSAFEKILSEARKYKLCLTLTHQYISQLDEKTKNAILANVGTIVMFQSYPADANALRPELGQFEPTDVTNLSTEHHEALCKPATQSKDTFKFTTNPPLTPLAQSNQRAIIEYTRARYSRKPQAQPPLDPKPHKPHKPLRPIKDIPKVHASSQEWRLSKKPNKAVPKTFATAQDRILHYIGQAGYLTTPQIISLCYGHLKHNPASQKVSASNDLKKLQNKKLLEELFDRRPKIYYVGNRPNVTAHDLALRDLFVKIELSNFEIAKIDFSPQLGKLNPDLRVDFVIGESSFETFWEYDTGTEPLAELVSKVERYEKVKPIESPVVFVFETQARLDQARKLLVAPFCIAATLQQFAMLTDPAFYFSCSGKQNNPQPLFG